MSRGDTDMLGIVVICVWVAVGVLITVLTAASWSAPWPDKSERSYAGGRINDVRVGLTILTVGFAWTLTQLHELWNLPWRLAVFLLIPLAVGIVWRRATASRG